MKKLLFNITIAAFVTLMPVLADASFFGAYYTRLDYEDEITGKYADIVVKLDENQQLIFSRESSYLPYWETEKGKWFVDEIVPRKGDGNKIKPDKYNRYSYVRIIENSPSKVIIHWRYIADFKNLNFDGVVHEIYTVTPDGIITRRIREGRKKITVFEDPRNIATQKLKLEVDGIKELSYTPANPPVKSLNPPVDGSPVITDVVGFPAAWWKFDEGLKPNEDKTEESISRINCVIDGNKSLWKKGISGTALGFDGYYSKITLPASRVPSIKSGLTVEAWIALGAYPFDWAPIVNQCEWKKRGYYFGIDKYGHLGLMVAVGGKWETLRSSEQIPLKRWTHVAGNFDKPTGKLYLYIDGGRKGSKKVAKNDIEMSNTDLLIGLNSMKLSCPGLPIPAIIGIEGLIDEVKIYDEALGSNQISESYKKFKPGAALRAHPDLQARILPGETGKADKFGAYYTKLKYHDLWDNMWRTSDYPDIVVKFDEYPTSAVFWHGTNYGPGWVTEKNIWMADQSVETGGTGKGCCEHMSDKQCRFSHVRLIENTDARVVVHWRYASVDVLCQFPNEKCWTDEYFTIYPDGLGVRKVNCHAGNIGWQDNQFLSQAGTTPEDNINLQALILADLQLWAGVTSDTLVLDWSNGLPKNTLEDANIELVNFKSNYKVFLIFQEGTYIRPWAVSHSPYSHFVAWNHWPVAQIPSDGRGALFPDRVTHSALAAADNVVFHGNMAIYGFTDKSISSLLPLTESWNYPPELKNIKGGCSSGFDKAQRAYLLQTNSSEMSFDLIGSEISPIYNPCFVIKNWGKSTSKATLKINGKFMPEGKDFRQGLIRDTDGTQIMVIWIKYQSTSPESIEITRE